MYAFTSRIRYSEINEKKELDLASIINYFQDCSTFHSEEAKAGISYLESRNRLWMMNSWQIIISRFPLLFETIKISTWPYDFKGIYGYRNFTIQDERGRICAAANSIWVNMDTITGRPAKIEDEDSSRYELEERLDMDYAPRKIKMPEAWDSFEPFAVVSSNIDTNHHVNNGQYVKMAENYLPEPFPIGQMRAEYRKAAVLGDRIVPKVSISGDTCIVALDDEEGNPYAIVEFRKGAGNA